MDFDPDYKFVKEVLQKAEPTLKNIGFRTLGVLSYLPELSKCSRDEVTAQAQEHGDTRGIEILLSDLRRHPELFVTFCAALYIENQAAYKEVTKRTWNACRGDEQMFRQFVYKLKDKLRDLDHKDGENISADQLIQQFTLGIANPNIQPANPIPVACLPIVQRELPAANPQPPSPARPVCAVSSLEHRVTQMPGYQPINYDEMLRYFNIHTESIGDLKSHVYDSLGKELNKADPNSNDKRPYWDKILRDPKCSLNVSRKQHRELGRENNSGETLLDKMDDNGHSLADLARVFIERHMLGALQVLHTHYEEVISRRLTEPPVTRPDTSYSYLNENNLNTALERSARSSVSDNQNIPAGASSTDLQSLQTDPTKIINTSNNEEIVYQRVGSDYPNVAEPMQEIKSDELSSFAQQKPEIDATAASGKAPTTEPMQEIKSDKLSSFLQPKPEIDAMVSSGKAPTTSRSGYNRQGWHVWPSESHTFAEHEDSSQREESLQDSDQSVDSEKIGNQSSDVSDASVDPNGVDSSKAPVPAEQDVTGVQSTPNPEMDCQKLEKDRVNAYGHDDSTDNLYSFVNVQQNSPAAEVLSTDGNQRCGQDGESTASSGLTHEFYSTTPIPVLAAEWQNKEPGIPSQGLVVRRSESPTLVEHEDSSEREESLQDSGQSVDSEKASGDPGDSSKAVAVRVEQDVTGGYSTPNADIDRQKLQEDREHQHSLFVDVQPNSPEVLTTDCNQSCGQDGAAICGPTHGFGSTTPSPALAVEGQNMEPEQS